MHKEANLDDGLAAGLEEAADGPEVGWQIFMANSLYHLTAHHLHMWSSSKSIPADSRYVHASTLPSHSPLYLREHTSKTAFF